MWSKISLHFVNSYFNLLIWEGGWRGGREEEREREGEGERWLCCPCYLCIHWSLLVCVLTRALTHNLGLLEPHCNQLTYLVKDLFAKSFFKKDFIYLFLERREGREIERERNINVREKYWLVACHMCPDCEPNLQPRHVLWWDNAPTNWATLAGPQLIFDMTQKQFNWGNEFLTSSSRAIVHLWTKK